MAMIKELIVEKTDEERASLMSTEMLKNSYYIEHDCMPGEVCHCAFCNEYRKRIKNKDFG